MEDDTPTRKSVGTIGDAELATGPAIITLQRWRRIWGYVSQLAIILLHVGPSGARTFGGLGHGGTCVCRRVGMRRPYLPRISLVKMRPARRGAVMSVA